MRPRILLCLTALLALAGCHSMPTDNAAPATAQPTAPAFTLPATKQFTLENGLTVTLMPRQNVPLISVHAVIRAGSVNDDLSGLAGLTAQSLRLGAAGQSKQQIEQQVDFIGASLDAYADRDGSTVRSDFMSRDGDKMLPLLRDVLLHPDFDAAEFAKLKERAIAGIEQDKQNPRDVIGRYFSWQLFGSHPYGNPVSGTQASLKKLTREEIHAFHRRFYQPGNTALCVVGDFDADSMKSTLRQLFGDWTPQDLPVVSPLKNSLPKPVASRVLLVNKPDAQETTFIIGGKGIARSSPDYIGLKVVNTVLGGRFTSWLNDELRVNSGLTYGAWSGFAPFCESGQFQISSFTRTKSTEEALDLTLKTYQRLWDRGIDAATLASAKAYVKGQFPLRFQTNAQLAGLLADMHLYGVDASAINDFQQQVDQLTEADCRQLINDYFPKDNLQIVLIGIADEIAPVAAKYGTVTRLDITDPGFGE